MKLGILTITPNIGIGGNLQAFAVKRFFEDHFGFNVSTIKYKYNFNLRCRLSYLLHALYSLIVKHKIAPFTPEEEYNYISKNIRPFQKQYLNFTKKVTSPEKLHRLINTSFDYVVVGSDQVWRPKYVNGIENYFLDGISTDVRKISLSASFGTKEWEFDEEQTRSCSKLINKFDYISVRELSGIGLVTNKLGCKEKPVYCDLDPTMLISVDEYRHFLEASPINSSYIFTYILDKTKDKESIINYSSSFLNKVVYKFNTNAEHKIDELKNRIAPSIEEWLTGIYYSDFVVTDSFHGCVFSILFNKPFLVYVNEARGAERFITLLNRLELQERMISDSSQDVEKIINTRIDWDAVNGKIASLKKETIERLFGIINFI